MRLIPLMLTFLLFPALLWATTCTGRDLTPDLSTAERAQLDAALAEQAYPEGLLWQAKRGETTLWLFGTFHIFDAEALRMLGRLRPLIELADMVYVEGTREDMQRLQEETLKRPEIMFNYDNPTLPDTLSAEEWRLLSEAVSARGMPSFLAAKMAPWLVSVTVSLPVCVMELRKSGLEGLDLHIMDIAAEKGKPLHALEPYDTIFTVFAGLSFDDQIRMVRAAIPAIAFGDDLFATMRQQYLDGRVLEIWEFSRLLSYKMPGAIPAEVDQMMATTESAMIRDRNHDWLSRLLPATEGKSAFIAAGALHMNGNNGLLNLLAQQGFELTRLDGNSGIGKN